MKNKKLRLAFASLFAVATFAGTAVTQRAHAACPDPFERCEAESYDRQSGTRNVTGNDASNRLQVGYINNGDWLAFDNVDFGAQGTTELSFQYTKGSRNATVMEVRLGSRTGTLIGSQSLSSSGGWRSNRQAQVEITRTTGRQTLYVVFTGATRGGYLMDLDWLQFAERDDATPTPPAPPTTPTPPPPPTAGACGNPLETCELESHDSQKGTRSFQASAASAGRQVGYINNGDWLSFRGVDFGAGEVMSASVSYAKGSSTDASIELRLGSATGKLIGRTDLEPTNNWRRLVDIEFAVLRTAGVQELYMVFKGNGSGYLVDVDTLDFSTESVSTPEPTPTPTPTPTPNPTPTPIPPGTHPDIVKIIDVSGANPGGISWADSYSVGDKCYCRTTFDHNIGPVKVDTPVGKRTVRQICNALGSGPGLGGNRPIYNDVQCGNGPANDAIDEKQCPGRVDIGRQGCGHIGPKWDLSGIR